MTSTPVRDATTPRTDEQCRGCGKQTNDLTWNRLCDGCNLGYPDLFQ